MSRFLLLVVVLSLAGCGTGADDTVIEATLLPGDFDGEKKLRWSPKAAAVSLAMFENGLSGMLHLGNSGGPAYSVRLEKSGLSPYFDVLKIDGNQDGAYDESETISTLPSESRYKMWSSFTYELSVPVRGSDSETLVENPYPMSLWYVQDLRDEQEEYALRFTRSGWMQGRVQINGVEAHIRISESKLDGVFDMEDEWTLALPDSIHNLFSFDHHRPAKRHAWLGEDAYRIVSMDLTGRSVQLEAIDPGVTREKEALDDDQTRVDRMAPHSGENVAFLHDFEAAEAQARAEGKQLFVDFETVWCGPCKTMEEWVYSADSVVEASRSVISVKVDGDEHPDIVDRFEVVGYPTMMLISPSGEVTSRLVGYQGVEAMTGFLSQATSK